MEHGKIKDTTQDTTLTIDVLKEKLINIEDAEIIEHQFNQDELVTVLYIRTLVDEERFNESIIAPLNRCTYKTLYACIDNSKVTIITSLEDALNKLFSGSIILYDSTKIQWLSVQLENSLHRAIQTSSTETVIYGAKDSFIENISHNILMIRRRLAIPELKSEKFTVGYLSKTTVVLMYIEGITNPEIITYARKKIKNINFDQFLDSSQIAAFIEDHQYSIFPQFLQTDRPDACAFALGEGKITILVNNTPFALIAPITFFHLFQSPEDYFLRWPIASFLRLVRYVSFILSMILIPAYVALTTHHYQIIPLQILFVILESRSKLPFTPFWEALLMLITLEIIKEASLRMPTKTSQTLGVIGGIVVGQAAVEAGFASKVLIVLMGISAIAFFLVPNYLMTKANVLIQFSLLLLASFMGIFGLMLGAVVALAHLNSLTSLKQPYLAPFAPFYWKDWIDLFIRGPLTWMTTRPNYLKTLQKWRYSSRR
nr:spore germination protein [Alkalihalobacterium alkalinitrilicum]